VDAVAARAKPGREWLARAYDACSSHATGGGQAADRTEVRSACVESCPPLRTIAHHCAPRTAQAGSVEALLAELADGSLTAL
jgi:hypothetical protein